MKKVLVTFVLALTAGAMTFAQQPTAPAPNAQQPAASASNPGASQTPTSQKVIKDPAEYNAYITALNTTDPAAKAAAMEAFVQQYPNSIVKIDALEQAMAAYQQANNQAKVEDTAKRILQLDQNNIRALAIVAFIDRTKASTGNAQALQSTCSESEAGLQHLPTWQKPEGLSDADFQKLKNQMSNIFEGAAGFCALQAKNYAVAKEHYTKSLQIEPNNYGDMYQLAIAELNSNPMELTGFWHCAKAMNLAQAIPNGAAAVQSINGYCKAFYHNYHGNDQGWDQFVQQTGALTAPPSNIAQMITPKPTPCDLAVQAVQQNDVTQLSFGDKEFILQQKGCSPAGTEAADKVWQSIQDLQKGGQAKLKIPVKVISATSDSIDAAITEDNQTANKADLHVMMDKPMTKPPAAGTMTDIIGIITNYTPNPFMFTMEKGELPAAKKPPVHHAPTRKKKKAAR
jgi:tetratricopeptide (TPR) repeat protein